jgi:hypothetical protein
VYKQATFKNFEDLAAASNEESTGASKKFEFETPEMSAAIESGDLVRAMDLLLKPNLVLGWRHKFSIDPDLTIAEAMVRFTPEMAQYILTHFNVQNRNPGALDVKRSTKDVIDLKWNPDLPDNTIVVSDIGRLINGQHRMLASIASGKAMIIRVEMGHPQAVASKLDRSRVRTTEQQADILGRDRGEKKDFAPMKILWLIDNEKTNYQLPSDYVFELIDSSYPARIRNDVPVAIAGKHLICQARGALFFLSMYFPEECKAFVKEMDTLMFSQQDGGPQLLYKYMNSTAFLKEKQTYEGKWSIIYKTFHAFSLFLQQATRTKLRVTDTAVSDIKRQIAAREGEVYTPVKGGPFDPKHIQKRRKKDVQ